MSKVLVFATNKQACYDLFMESCRRYEIDPIVLGWGEKWIGFGKKMMKIRENISTNPDDEIIISVDPFDVIFLCGLEEIENKFKKLNVLFLCGALNPGFLMQQYIIMNSRKQIKKLQESQLITISSILEHGYRLRLMPV